MIPVSKNWGPESKGLMLKNVPTLSGNISDINSEKSVPLVKHEVNNYHLVTAVKKKWEDLSVAAVMENKIIRIPVVKTEPEWAYENKHISINNFMYKDEPELIDIRLEVIGKNEECVVGFSDKTSRLDQSQCFISKHMQVIPVKTENQVLKSDVVIQDWRVKHEEVDLKEEVLPESEISLPGVSNQEKQKYKCQVCDYQTDWKGNLKKHHLKHKNPEEVDFFRCDKCEYQTRYKSNLKNHYLKHKNPEEVVLFECDNCPFKTLYRKCLKEHHSKHKDPREVDFFRCDKCEYQTRYISNLKEHFLKHKSLKEVDLFKCDECAFETRYRKVLKKHLLRHQNPEEIDSFRCDKCEYRTVHKRYLNRHLERHFLEYKNPEEVDFLRCDKCEYRTIHKRYLKRHLDRHLVKHKNRSRLRQM